MKQREIRFLVLKLACFSSLEVETGHMSEAFLGQYPNPHEELRKSIIENLFFETMDQFLRITDAIGPLRKYTSGIHSSEGDLYLAVYTYAHPDNSLWIHQFDSTGELVRRYELISEVELTPYIDMDFTGRRIFVVTEEAEIRAYSF